MPSVPPAAPQHAAGARSPPLHHPPFTELLLLRPPTLSPEGTMSLGGSAPNADHVGVHTASRGRTMNAHTHSSVPRRDNGVRADVSSGHAAPAKPSRTHNELHKELLLAHKKGLALSSRSELQRVLERRKRVETDQHDEQQHRSPLEDVLLRRQQSHRQREKEQHEELRAEAQLMEFVRVRQNLRKIHSVMQDKAANP